MALFLPRESDGLQIAECQPEGSGALLAGLVTGYLINLFAVLCMHCYLKHHAAAKLKQGIVQFYFIQVNRLP